MAAALSSSDLAESMSRANNSAQMAGVSMDTYIGYLTTVQDVTQRSAESVGEAFKTVFSRLGNVKAGKFAATAEDMQSEDYNEDEYEALNDVEKVLDSIGIKLKENARTYRDTEDVIKEIADVWDTLDETTQNAVTTALAGTRQRELVLTLFENYDQVEKFAQIAANSYGTAQEKMEAFTDSIEAAQNRLTVAIEDFSMRLNQSNTIKMFYNGLSYVINNLDKLAAAIALVVGVTNKGAITKGVISGLGTVGGKISSMEARMSSFSGSILTPGATGQLWKQAQENIKNDRIEAQLQAYGDALEARTLSLTTAEREELKSVETMVLSNKQDLKNLQIDYMLGNIGEEEYIAKSKEVIESQMNLSTDEKAREQEIKSIQATDRLTQVRNRLANTSNSSIQKERELLASTSKKIDETRSGSAIAPIVKGLGTMIGGLVGGTSGANIGETYLGEGGGVWGGLLGGLLGGVGGSKLGNLVGNIGKVGSVFKGAGLKAALGTGAGLLGGGVGVAITAASIFLPILSKILTDNQKKIEEVQNLFKEESDKYTELLNASVDTGRYDELSEGVDNFGNNVSLTDEEYQEFLNISNQLAQTFPELITYTDQAGNSFLGMDGKVGKVTDSVNELIEAQQKIADEAMLTPEVMGQDFGETRNEFLDIQKELESLKEERAAAYKGLRNSYDPRLKEGKDTVSYERYSKIIEDLDRQIESVQKKLNDYSFEYQDYIDGAIRSNDRLNESYKSLEDEQKSMVDSMINSIDFSQYGEDDTEKFVQDVQNMAENAIDHLDEIAPVMDVYYNLNPDIPASVASGTRPWDGIGRAPVSVFFRFRPRLVVAVHVAVHQIGGQLGQFRNVEPLQTGAVFLRHDRHNQCDQPFPDRFQFGQRRCLGQQFAAFVHFAQGRYRQHRTVEAVPLFIGPDEHVRLGEFREKFTHLPLPPVTPRT